MKLAFPSAEFDDAVAGVCHGSATEAEMQALNELLRSNPGARDGYLLRIELHTRLASDPELFSEPAGRGDSHGLPDIRAGGPRRFEPEPAIPRARSGRLMRGLALAACFVLIALGIWAMWSKLSPSRNGGATSMAVAMLTRTVDAEWANGVEPPRIGGALGPGMLRLQSGMAQIVFYSGARVIIEGPAELKIVSPMEAVCPFGRFLIDVPPPAHGFRLKTAQFSVVDLGTSFAISATNAESEVHVFNGKVALAAATAAKRPLAAGQAAVVGAKGQARITKASTEGFGALFEFRQRSLASEAYRYEQWQFANAKLNQDPALLVHLDFETPGTTEWTLRNTAEKNRSVSEATIVGCARAEGRWREKLALEFQSVNDRVRLAVPGEFEGLTLSAWVCLKGLDRQFNSLFMSDGFDPGTVHWLIRDDGVLGLTVFGEALGEFQIVASPPVISRDTVGMWQHLAVVLDGEDRQVIHYLNGIPVSQTPMKIAPPFRVGTAELGNWNARSGAQPAPVLVRNLSGSFDEFALFSRALSPTEVRELYTKGQPTH